MLATTSPGPARARRAGTLRIVYLLSGFGLSVLLRVLLGGDAVADSVLAGLVFAGSLVGISIAAGPLSLGKPSPRILLWGLLGAVILFAPIAMLHTTEIQAHTRPLGNYGMWALIVTVVAASEELFLRGTLYDAVCSWRGTWLAILVTAVGFALLHVPLYGWHVVPLDLVVGLVLGCLRLSSGSWVAPGITHILADLGAWWIV